MAAAGVNYPVGADGKTSTVRTGKNIIAAALDAVDEVAANSVRQEKEWHGSGYVKHIANTLVCGLRGANDTLRIAQAGLDYAYSHFRFVDKNTGTTTNLHDAISSQVSPTRVFKTSVIHGTRRKEKGAFAVPRQGRVLQGAALLKQLKIWEDTGVAEPSACQGVRNMLQKESNYCHQLENHLFVVMGAGAAMGPFEVLLDLGLNVVAIDLDRQPIWTRLKEKAVNSPGTLFFPTSSNGNEPNIDGCNLLTDFPAVAHWLAFLMPGYSMTIGNYAYMDGKNFVKIVLAMDCISSYVLREREVVDPGERRTSLAYLCSPTDVFMWPKEAYAAAKRNFDQRGWVDRTSSAASFGRFCRSNAESNSIKVKDHRIIECFVTQQGPNYALAKRIQHWRALVARSEGFVVSSNVAPSSWTKSVTSNTLLAAAYDGTSNFPPLEIFEPKTSNAVMTGMLIDDICNPSSAADPSNALSHPLYLFSFGAWHGGFWRSPYHLGSIVELAAVYGLLDQYKFAVSAAGLATSAAVAAYIGRSKL